MKTELLSPTSQALQKAASLLRAGELCAFPTETVYGLGANALDENAVRKIFAAKGRPADNPLIVHVDCAEAARPLCHISEDSQRLMEAFWPGPLTLLMPKTDLIPPVVNAGLRSVAVRLPSHPVARAMLRECGLPIAAPSANLSGKPSPTTAEHVLRDMDGRIPLILDGGPCEVGVESTVLDMTCEIPTVLRPGGVTPEMLLTVLPVVKVADSVLRPLREGEVALSPGMRYRHYAPTGQLTLVTGEEKNVSALCKKLYDQAQSEGHNPYLLSFEEHLPLYQGRRVISIGQLTHPATVAARIFAVLRQMDDLHADVMLCEALAPTGVGLAIMNRLSRAAAFHTLSADEEQGR